MTNLGRIILKQCDDQGIKAGEMAARIKIDPSVISNMKSDRKFYLDFKTLMKIYIGVSPDQAIRNEIVSAYLADIVENLPSLDSSKININITAKSRRNKEEPNKSISERYSAIVQALMNNEVRGQDLDNILFIVEHIKKDPNLRQAVDHIIHIIKR